MNLVQFSTERRVTIAMVTIVLVLFGLIGLSRLKINLLPDLSYPSVTIRTEYTGAAPQEIETLLSKPIEEVLGTVKNVTKIRSTSRTGQSDVMLEFAWGTDMEDARVDVREKLEVLQLPLDVKKPLLLRFDPSTEPVLRYALTGKTDEAGELRSLRTYADEDLKKWLDPIAGVAAAKISGGLEEQIEVSFDPAKLAQLNIDAGAVISKLAAENINLAGGRLNESNQRFLVRTIAQFTDTDQMRELIVANRPTASGEFVPVRLGEVASVISGSRERDSIIRVDGREAIEVAIYKEGDANTVAVSKAVRVVMEKLKEDRVLPQTAKLTQIEDQARFINNSIAEVVEAAILGGILSVLVIYLFLGEAWATVVISLSLPVSIIASFFFMQRLGISLNVMSLGGIALATGMVVDNAIVVLENIKRLRDKGLSVIDATVKGTSEVGMAITASTLTHIAVFLPLIFVQGISGQLFRDQALTVTFAMLLSLFVALTLIPMLASLEGEHPARFAEDAVTHPAKFGFTARIRAFFGGIFSAIGRFLTYLLSFPAGLVQRFFSFTERVYVRLLDHCIRRPWPVLLISALSLLSAVWLAPQLGVELIPEFAQGRLQMDLKLPPGTPLAQTDQRMQQLQVQGEGAAHVDSLYATSGSGTRLDASPTDAGENVARMMIQLKPGTPREDEPGVINQFRQLAAEIPGAEAKFGRPQLFSFDTPLEVEIKGEDLDQLRAVALEVLKKMRGEAIFADVKSTFERGAPEVRIYFDQEKVSALGLSVRDVADQLVRQVRGEVATKYSLRDRKIDVLVRAQEIDRDSLDAIKRLIVNPQSAQPTTLESVARIEVKEGPSEIRRNNQERVALISANVIGADLGAGADRAKAVLASVQLPANMTAQVAGQSQDMQASFNSLIIALALAIFLVYLVMASQFESLLHPFLILFSIPLALVGAVYALWLTKSTVSVIVFIGLIMLVGIVVSNAIVLIDRVNQLRASGVAKTDALMQAGKTRLRPIVMTTLTTLVGFLPMAMGLGEGAELRAPLAITVIGGLTFSTLLTLVVVPVLYQLIDRRTSLPAHMMKTIQAEQGS